MGSIRHLTTDELEAGLSLVRAAPTDVGTLDLIVRRPAVDAREVLEEGRLDLELGLVGDTWIDRPSGRTPDGRAHPDMQLNIISSRLIALVSPDPARRALAGDQLHVDLDLSVENLPDWTRLRIGDAVIEITDQPHTGCAKFVERYGRDAMRFVNSETGRAMGLRGRCARVAEPGAIRCGDKVEKLPA